ncbi:MAG: adenylate kinase [Candidatus Omnitrophica bacterium]|nr:adenylate kinase [Candidatus Omnitrophota bacterium]
MNMVLLGPPGAGKGTQADMLIKAYGLLHISTGAMLREAVKEGGELGAEIETYMNSGELVPDDIVTKAVTERMNKPDAADGVILDGYPRTRIQAESLDKALREENKSLDTVLYFKTSEEVAVYRLSGRRVCEKCGKNYHVVNIPPRVENICDKCNVKLIQREDDSPETVKNRLAVYGKRTKDLIVYYNEKGLLNEVDGDVQAKKLFDEIDILLKKKGLIENDDSN